MFKNVNSINDLKRITYLFILPGLLVAAISTLLLQVATRNYSLQFYCTIIFMLFYITLWILAYKRHPFVLFEKFLIVIIGCYYVVTILFEVLLNYQTGENDALSIFTIWYPLFMMYIFMVLPRKSALFASIVVVALPFIPSVLLYGGLHDGFRDSLLQFYVASIIYIVILFVAQSIINSYIEIKAVEKQFYVDQLTQVGNRHQIDIWLKDLLHETVKLGEVSVVFFDIDFFKRVNDQFGHQAGDEVLKAVAQIVRQQLSAEQHIGRWGGEEFIVLLKEPECIAYEIAEKLRLAIAAHDFPYVGQVTASFGVTSNMEGDTAGTILLRVDKRLYLSKEKGRNRVTGKIVT
ncbi:MULTISPECIES: GGDEF domain-containing protein [Sporosarcina]|uniref:GGDEF domain-containing protein n=1 Tax=Sporosarcina contaminans TaxID=633403 RepID=A0ABW3TYN8_9BACL